MRFTGDDRCGRHLRPHAVGTLGVGGSLLPPTQGCHDASHSPDVQHPLPPGCSTHTPGCRPRGAPEDSRGTWFQPQTLHSRATSPGIGCPFPHWPTFSDPHTHPQGSAVPPPHSSRGNLSGPLLRVHFPYRPVPSNRSQKEQNSPQASEPSQVQSSPLPPDPSSAWGLAVPSGRRPRAPFVRNAPFLPCPVNPCCFSGLDSVFASSGKPPLSLGRSPPLQACTALSPALGDHPSVFMGLLG